MLSLSFAVLHGILELFVLSMEADATRTGFVHYCILCFNGRFGWIPFQSFIVDHYKNPKRTTKVESALEYKNMKGK